MRLPGVGLPSLTLAILALTAFALPLPAAPRDEPPAAAPPPALPWVYDIPKALEQAKDEGRDLLIYFTGSDWCAFCKRLDQEILSRPAFVERFSKEFVFLFVDFPEREKALAKVVDEERSEELRIQHGVTGYPTLILCDPAGNPYGRTGLRGIGVEQYIAHIVELRKGGEKVKALLAVEDPDASKGLLVAAFPVLASQGLLAYAPYEKYFARAEGIDSIAAAAKFERALIGLRDLLPPKKNPPDWDAVHLFISEHDNLTGPDFMNACWRCATQHLAPKGKPAEALVLLRRMLSDPMLAKSEKDKKLVLEKIAELEQAVKDAGG
jgi:thioredoxin-related protein